MEKIRLLLVDDSLLIRSALRDCFRADPEIEIVGVADSGLKALEQIQLLQPDVVTLDIEMPEMNGLETLQALRASGSDVPVIIFSQLTSRGVAITMEALELGATDIVDKPSKRGENGNPVELAKRQLRSRIRALGRKQRKRAVSRPVPIPQTVPILPKEDVSLERPMRAAAISVSTGGPSALLEIVSKLSEDIVTPIFITQHMPPVFTKYLAERLTSRGPLKAYEAQTGMPVEPGKIYVAPGDFHLEVTMRGKKGFITLSQAPHENSCRPSADVMLRSLAAVYAPDLLSIVMTGMGQDGKNGCHTVKTAGGLVVVQDEASSLVWGMPRAVVASNLHDAVLPLTQIPDLINKSCGKRSSEDS